MVNDEIGRAGVPAHYADASGREVIDIIRDALGDDGFRAYCAGSLIKYRRRAGKKGDAIDAARDQEKALWYADMLSHLNGEGPDPRAFRPGFVPYSPQRERGVQTKEPPIVLVNAPPNGSVRLERIIERDGFTVWVTADGGTRKVGEVMAKQLAFLPEGEKITIDCSKAFEGAYDAGVVVLAADQSITLDEYQKRAMETAFYPNVYDRNGAVVPLPVYPALGLAGEAGEFAEKIKKAWRDGTSLDREKVLKELGDLQWYIAAAAQDLDATLGEVGALNLQKLTKRKTNGTLGGAGDDR